MSRHKSVLIQDCREYFDILSRRLDRLMEPYQKFGVCMESTLFWILAEELELIYGLFVIGHMHNAMPYMVLHSNLNSALPVPLSVLTSNYVKAPKIYLDNYNVRMEIKGTDLLIHYSANISDYNVLSRLNEHHPSNKNIRTIPNRVSGSNRRSF